MKTPPLAKVYEALTTIASNRIKMFDNYAIVSSSNLKKSYTVTWKNNQYASNDNATYWQGYPGYPIIAVLFLQGRLNLNTSCLPYLKDINWHELNEQYKRNYDEAILAVLEKLDFEIRDNIEAFVEKSYQDLLHLNIEIVRKIKDF